MGVFGSIAGFLVMLTLFSEPLQGAFAFFTGIKDSAVVGFMDEGLVVLLMVFLGLKAFRGIRIPPHFLWWIPFMVLFTLSWAANRSSPVLAANLIFAFLKPFILAVAAVNFLDIGKLPKLYRLFLFAICLQVPFLIWQLSKIGYVTGTAADDYVGCINASHGVAALALVPSLWLMGMVYWRSRNKEPVGKLRILASLFLFFITILTEAKFLYMGAILGILGFLVLTERTRLIPLLPRLALGLIPLLALVFMFGWEYFSTSGYEKSFEIFQKLEAYYVTFYELPDKIPYPFLGAGPGMYGSAIAVKFMPPLADHFFGDIMRELTVGGTFMTPFSEINGAFGEFGYLGPFLLLTPYIAHLAVCLGTVRTLKDPFEAGALFCCIVILFILLFGTVFLPALVQSQETFPCFVISSIAIAAHSVRTNTKTTHADS